MYDRRENPPRDLEELIKRILHRRWTETRVGLSGANARVYLCSKLWRESGSKFEYNGIWRCYFWLKWNSFGNLYFTIFSFLFDLEDRFIRFKKRFNLIFSVKVIEIYRSHETLNFHYLSSVLNYEGL